MPITEIKPIRSTEIYFNDSIELNNFIDYATSKEKTDSEIMNRVRRELISHKRSPRRK